MASSSASSNEAGSYIPSLLGRLLGQQYVVPQSIIPIFTDEELFILKKINLALNIVDSYKDLTPSSGEALGEGEKKVIFKKIIDQIFDIQNELNPHSDKFREKYLDETLSKDTVQLLFSLLLSFYPEGIDPEKGGADKLNDINNAKISIGNLINKYVNVKSFEKYNQHMPPDDMIRELKIKVNGVNIFRDTGVFPKSILLPNMYKIIYTPGTFIDPALNIRDRDEERQIIIALEDDENLEYDLNHRILEKYGLSDVISGFHVSIQGSSVKYKMAINTIGGLDETGNIRFEPTIIEVGFNRYTLDRNYGYQRMATDEDGSRHHIFVDKNRFEGGRDLTTSQLLGKQAQLYFEGNTEKNGFIKHYINYNVRGERIPDSQFDEYLPRLAGTPFGYKLHNEIIKYIVIKELGDTLQVAWIDKILEDNINTPNKFKGVNGLAITRKNVFIETVDKNIINRALINGYNCILSQSKNTSYYYYPDYSVSIPILPEEAELQALKFRKEMNKLKQEKREERDIKYNRVRYYWEKVKTIPTFTGFFQKHKSFQEKKKGGNIVTIDYNYKDEKKYFKNPGYMTYYVLCNFPRIFLMAYSIGSYVVKKHNININEINNILLGSTQIFEQKLSSTLSQVFGNINEFDYYFDLYDETEYKKRIYEFETYDNITLNILNFVYTFMNEKSLFIIGNEKLHEMLNNLLKDYPVVLDLDKELLKILYSDSKLTTNIETYFKLLIESNNFLADLDEIDTINPITFLEEAFIQEKEYERILLGINTIDNINEIYSKVTKNMVQNLVQKNGTKLNMKPKVINRNTRKNAYIARRLQEREIVNAAPELMAKLGKQAGPLITPNSEEPLVYTNGYNMVKPKSTGLVITSNTEEPQPYYGNLRTTRQRDENPTGLVNGGRRKTKKRTPLKHKRTRRKERK